MIMELIDLKTEFDRQVDNLVQKNYPQIIGCTEDEFRKQLEPLKEQLNKIKIIENHLPFIIVIKKELIPLDKAMGQIKINGEHGIVNTFPNAVNEFKVIPDIAIPDTKSYMITNVDTGRETLNIRPEDALTIIKNKGRSPLTTNEGVALVTQYPEILIDKKKYNCFSMLASRRGDQKVPALWISYKKPRLGWCWDRNPHTWLGSASCGERLGS